MWPSRRPSTRPARPTVRPANKTELNRLSSNKATFKLEDEAVVRPLDYGRHDVTSERRAGAAARSNAGVSEPGYAAPLSPNASLHLAISSSSIWVSVARANMSAPSRTRRRRFKVAMVNFAASMRLR